MKKIFLLYIALLGTFSVSMGQDFIIKYASQNGQIPANLNSFLNNDNNFLTRDLNGDGIPDLPVFIMFQDSVAVRVFNGFSNEVIWQRTGLAHQDELTTNPKLAGFTDFGDSDNPETMTAILTENHYNDSLWCRVPSHPKEDGLTDNSNDMDPAVILIDVATKQGTWGYRKSRLLGLTDIDNDGYPDLALEDMLLHRIVVAGVDTDNFNEDDDDQGFNNNSSSSNTYELSLKYESEGNAYLASQNLKFNNLGDLDLDGDGFMDLITNLVVDDTPTGIQVVDGLTQEVQWSFSFPEEYEDNIRAEGFHGFFDLNGDEEKEAVMGNNVVVTLDQTAHLIGESFKIQAILDIDLDGYPDLLGRDTVNNNIQIWGKSTATATTAYIDHLADLAQNFPNPFQETTQISYTLDESAWVQLTVFDATGRQLVEVFSATQSEGTHRVELDAKALGLTAGTYYYQLKVNEQAQTKKMILIR